MALQLKPAQIVCDIEDLKEGDEFEFKNQPDGIVRKFIKLENNVLICKADKADKAFFKEDDEFILVGGERYNNIMAIYLLEQMGFKESPYFGSMMALPGNNNELDFDFKIDVQPYSISPKQIPMKLFNNGARFKANQIKDTLGIKE